MGMKTYSLMALIFTDLFPSGNRCQENAWLLEF
jgi:hypothetical protein